MQIASTQLTHNNNRARFPFRAEQTHSQNFLSAHSENLTQIEESIKSMDRFDGISTGIIKTALGATIGAAGGTLVATLGSAAMGLSGWGLAGAGITGFVVGGVIGGFVSS
jgi:hypothetical protein